VASARLVENALPEGSTWDGKDETSAQAAGEPVVTSAQ
jgi:hypothetical protein